MIKEQILNLLDKECDEFMKNTGYEADLFFMTPEDFKNYESNPEIAVYLQRSDNPKELSAEVKAFLEYFIQNDFMERVMTPKKRILSVFRIKPEYRLNLAGLSHKPFIASSTLALKSANKI